MRNFAKINNYANRLQAWRDWDAFAEEAKKIERADLIAKYLPPTNAGWRKIDKQIKKLRDAIEAAKK